MQRSVPDLRKVGARLLDLGFLGRTWSRVGMLALIGLGAEVPGQAVIIRAGASAEADVLLEARSHEAGVQYRCVVGLSVACDSYRFCATGVYLGTSPDGKRGLVLTAAHPFILDASFGPGEEPVRFVTLTFGPQREAKTAVAVGVPRVLIHPDFKYHKAFTDRMGCSLPITIPVHDLAILEFQMSEVLHQHFASTGFSPAVLLEEEHYPEGLWDAAIAGFGEFGTSSSPTDAIQEKLHAGHTKVQLGDWRGRLSLMHLSPFAKGTRAARESATADANILQFDLAKEELDCTSPSGRSRVPMQSHEDQALASTGDCGGPLFVTTKEGPRLAGIFLWSDEEAVAGASRKVQPCHLQLWEPVMLREHLDWIQTVQRGFSGGAEVLTLTRPVFAPLEHGKRATNKQLLAMDPTESS